MEQQLVTSGASRETRFDRVRAHSPSSVNEKIDLLTEARLARLEEAGPEEAARRLEELDREGDIDRALMLFFSVQLAFLGVHAAYGWCPPVALLRRLGFRTHSEIEKERDAVAALASRRA